METICGSQRLKKPRPRLARFGKKSTSKTSWITLPRPASARHTQVRFHARCARCNNPRWPGAYRTVLDTTQGGADATWYPPLPHACTSLRALPARSQHAGVAPDRDAVTRRGRRPGRCWSAWQGAARGTRPWGRRPSRQGTWRHSRWQPWRSERSRPRS